MFLPKNEAKLKVKSIILDDIDNDVIFIVANKGVGKLKLLGEIYDIKSYKREIIIADGKRIRCACSCLTKCYIDGICSYLERHNSLITRNKFVNILPQGYMTTQRKLVFIARRKISVETVTSALSKLLPRELKELYIEIAEDTPLVLFVGAIKLCSTDSDYLLDLNNDTWGARVTFIIAIRPTQESLKLIHNVSINKEIGVWVIPLLPDIIKSSEEIRPKSLASISINNVGNTIVFHDFTRMLLSYDVYFDMYSFVQSLLAEDFQPCHLFFLANQEMGANDYQYLNTVTETIYKIRTPTYDSRIILPLEGKLLWLDALSYYIALYEGIDKAIAQTQRFFFDVILHAKNFSYGKPARNAFGSFLKEASIKKPNQLAEGFSAYFSSFATLAKVFSSQKMFHKCSYENSMLAVQILNRVVLEFSESSIQALELIYGYTQVCAILDIGLETITYFFTNIVSSVLIEDVLAKKIAEFQKLCMNEAYKWSDITLLKEIVLLQKIMHTAGKCIKFEISDLTCNDENMVMYECLIQQLEKENMKIGEIIMRNTIFLSYAQADYKIANLIDQLLLDLGYDVKRDIRDVAPWDSLKQFMKSIRKQDYVVLLVSDTYLHRENCIYEVMQFLKDENYFERAFPIAIGFSEIEKAERIKNGDSCSMFDVTYWVDIVLYWQEYTLKLKKKIDQLDRENSAELDAKYRDIKNMAQSASEFLNSSFNEKLLGIIIPEKPKVEEVITRIDNLIYKKQLSESKDALI